MSVILIGMKKPEKCKCCKFCSQKSRYDIPQCGLTWKNVVDIEKVLPECPIEAIEESEPDPVDNKKSPLGIMPRELWEERRIREILAAMKRYEKENVPIPQEWIKELRDLMANWIENK